MAVLILPALSSNCTPSLYNNTVILLVPQNMLYSKQLKFILEHPMKAQRMSRGIALLFLQPRRSVGCKIHALPPGMTRYPLYRRLGGPQGRSGRVL